MKARWIFKKTSGSSEKLTFEAFEAFGQKVKKVKNFDFPGQKSKKPKNIKNFDFCQKSKKSNNIKNEFKNTKNTSKI